MKFVKDWLPYILILIAVILIRSFLFTPIKVQGSSMQDTLAGDEIMILWKIGDISRYDIVVADYVENGKKVDTLIKRVYGLPGETIKCEKGVIYINDHKIEDGYATNQTGDFDEVTLGEDEYFLMGDNRRVSKDSRMIGPLKRSELQGVTDFVLWPLNKFGKVE